MLEVQKFLHKNKILDLKNEFNIGVKVYDDRIVLKYRIDSKPKFSPIVRECRGLILSLRPGHMYEILSRPFDRFYNYNEGDDDKYIDWNSALVFNKLDGSLISVYYDTKKWCAATNGTAYAEGGTPLDVNKSYFDLFTEAINTSIDNAFKNCDKDCTYLFELTSPENRIVTRYTETKATLLAIRNKITGKFIDYDKLDPYINAMNWNCKLVDQYDFGSLGYPDKIINFVEGRDVMDEGVVVYDPTTQIRLKIKNASYVALHHLKGEGNNKKGFANLIFKQEQSEFLSYFPEYTDIINDYSKAYNAFINQIKKVWNENKHIKNQKEFALNVKDLKISDILFRLKKGISFENIVNSLTDDKKLNFLEYFKNL